LYFLNLSIKGWAVAFNFDLACPKYQYSTNTLTLDLLFDFTSKYFPTGFSFSFSLCSILSRYCLPGRDAFLH
jgi:hypothetical protein